MAMMIDIANKAKNAKFFRELAAELQHLECSDWTEWEWDWLGQMARNSDSYEHSETERAKLAQIYSYSRLLSGHDGRSVTEMVRACHRYHLDLAEEDSDFIVELYQRQAQSVRKRQLRRLVRLYAECGEQIAAA
jgi:hypothetical protein